MAKVYRPYFPEQDFLLPPSLREWLPERHLAYFVSDLIDQLDLSQIEEHYEREERGYPPYHPHMMTKVLVYGYCVGVFSSRRLEKRLSEDIAFRCWQPATSRISGVFSPVSQDHRTCRRQASPFTYHIPRQTTRPAALPTRTERHNPHSIATLRRQIATHLTRSLPRCPCCLRDFYNTVALGTRCNSGGRGVFSRDIRFLRFTIRLKSGSCWC